MLYRGNVDGTRNAVRAAAAAGVRRIVYTSSAATIGEAAGTLATEASPHRGPFLSHYERSKHEAERVALAEAARLGVELVAVNPASVQGPGRTRGTAKILIDALNGRLRMVVDSRLSVVDVADCAEGHLLAEERGAPGERYLLSGATLTVREAVALLARIAGTPEAPRRLPPPVAMAIATGVEGLARLRGRRPPVCREMVRTILHGHRYDGSRATRELGLVYTPIEESLRRAAEWYVAQGLVTRPSRPGGRPGGVTSFGRGGAQPAPSRNQRVWRAARAAGRAEAAWRAARRSPGRRLAGAEAASASGAARPGVGAGPGPGGARARRAGGLERRAPWSGSPPPPGHAAGAEVAPGPPGLERGARWAAQSHTEPRSGAAGRPPSPGPMQIRQGGAFPAALPCRGSATPASQAWRTDQRPGRPSLDQGPRRASTQLAEGPSANWHVGGRRAPAHSRMGLRRTMVRADTPSGPNSRTPTPGARAAGGRRSRNRRYPRARRPDHE